MGRVVGFEPTHIGTTIRGLNHLTILAISLYFIQFSNLIFVVPLSSEPSNPSRSGNHTMTILAISLYFIQFSNLIFVVPLSSEPSYPSGLDNHIMTILVINCHSELILEFQFFYKPTYSSYTKKILFASGLFSYFLLFVSYTNNLTVFIVLESKTTIAITIHTICVIIVMLF